MAGGLDSIHVLPVFHPDHVGAALHRAVLDALHQVVENQLARVGFVLEPSPQL